MRDNLYQAALLHHIDVIEKKTKDEQIQKYLDLADQYACAGVFEERKDFDFVASPFERLKKPKSISAIKYKYSAQSLNLSKSFFPTENEYTKDYNSLWNNFASEFKNLKQEGKAKAETTLHLLHKYAVTIPNPSNIHPEVSFYDYAKIKAGLAVCLYDVAQEADDINEVAPLLIIRADISGIQEFIGSIASKNASKNLKGRSFYVQLLVDTVLKLMLKKLKLYEGNVMYASGGNFFVIAPNTAFVKKQFKKFEEEITAAIFEEHKTRIAVVMGAQEVTHEQIVNGKIDEAIIQLFQQKIAYKKKQKFSTLIAKNYQRFFDETYGDEGGDSLIDVITGEEISHSTSITITDEDDDDEQLVSKKTFKQIAMGKNLKKTDFLITSEQPLTTDENLKREFEVQPLPKYSNPFYYYLVWEDKYKFFAQKQGVESIVALNNLNFLQKNGQSDFTLYGGNDAPIIIDKETGKERVKYFHELSGDGSFKRLGVLKMDVDGLGSIFQHAVQRKQLTFSYYAALSRNLDWFFKGYLNTIWEKNYNEDTQIIFSGGDDLFIIGKWNKVIAFAEDIKKTFAQFTCAEILDAEHQITISGGISIVTDKFPIMKANDKANSAEKKAKNHKLERKGEAVAIFEKNTINILGVSLYWETEYLLVKALKDDLAKYVGDSRDKLPRSFFGRIKSHYHQMMEYQKAIAKGQKANPRWIWNVVYDFSQFKSNQTRSHHSFLNKLKKKTDEDNKRILQVIKKSFNEQEQFVDDLKNGIFTNKYNNTTVKSNYHFLELLNLAARWAELEERTNKIF